MYMYLNDGHIFVLFCLFDCFGSIHPNQQFFRNVGAGFTGSRDKCVLLKDTTLCRSQCKTEICKPFYFFTYSYYSLCDAV